MKQTLAAVALIVLTAPLAVAQDNTAPAAVARQFVDAFNKGDVKGATAACAEQTSIVDEFPPHEWHGPGACAKWFGDFAADAKKNNITDAIVTIGAPKHADVTGDRAYLVVPAGYTYKQGGKPMKETGSAFTFAMQKIGATWRIIGWSWTKG